MIRSMTGFGAGRSAHLDDTFDVEVRSVNHKFCEVKVRLPRELASMELELSRAVKDRLARGGVEVALRRGGGRGALAPRVDFALAEGYAEAFRELSLRLGIESELQLSDVLAAEGVVSLEEQAVDPETVRAPVQGALAGALDHLEAMRAREGEALARDLRGRLDRLAALAARVEALAPESVERYRERLSERIAEVTRGHAAADPVRLAQEVALFADRLDIAEELTRLRSHVAQARALVEGDEPAGRKLEFLVQELHREVNTVGSKSQSAGIAALVVELKAEVERMREQVQNVE